MIKIINYGLGNIKAFLNLYNSLGIKISVANNYKDLEFADKIILPGVGSFDTAMDKLNKTDMRKVLDEKVLVKKVPVLGVCVGMQIMLNSSEEGFLKGLSWVDSKVKKINYLNKEIKSPHMGWNNINILNDHLICNNLNNNSNFYFLHSYFCDIKNDENIIAKTNYDISFPSIFNYDNIFGIQCHPEKSHLSGVNFLKNFYNI